MNKFLFNVVSFGMLCLFLFLSISMASLSLFKNNFNYQISTDKNILLVGDSRLECAVNDSILTNVSNACQSGSSYFYVYLKIREFIKFNPQIDTVIVGYSNHNLYKEWFVGEQFLVKVQHYFPLMEYKDLLALVKGNPLGVLKQIPMAILRNVAYVIQGNVPKIGKYNYLKRDKLEESIKRENEKEIKETPIVEVEAFYLKEIYKICEEKGLTLILLDAPIYPYIHKKNHQEKVNKASSSFAKTNLPNAQIVNHKHFKLPKESYGDLYHLNHKGAQRYSEFLTKNQFRNIDE